MRDHQGRTPIFFKWSEQAFITDTRCMHWQASLLYRALLQSAWCLSTRPDVPDDDAAIARILSVPEAVWLEHAADVRKMFSPLTVDGVRLLRQGRLHREWCVIEAHRAKQTELANRRWNKTRSENGSASASNDGEADEEVEVDGIRKAYAKAYAKAHAKASSSSPSLISSNLSHSSSGKMPDARPAGGVSFPAADADVDRTATPAAKSDDSTDVQRISSLCVQAWDKLPNPVDVRALLAMYPAEVIEQALAHYDYRLESRDRPFAEKAFFADRGCVAVVTAMSREATGRR